MYKTNDNKDFNMEIKNSKTNTNIQDALFYTCIYAAAIVLMHVSFIADTVLQRHVYNTENMKHLCPCANLMN